MRMEGVWLYSSGSRFKNGRFVEIDNQYSRLLNRWNKTFFPLDQILMAEGSITLGHRRRRFSLVLSIRPAVGRAGTICTYNLCADLVHRHHDACHEPRSKAIYSSPTSSPGANISLPNFYLNFIFFYSVVKRIP